MAEGERKVIDAEELKTALVFSDKLGHVAVKDMREIFQIIDQFSYCSNPDELDFKIPHKSIPVTLEVTKMRNPTKSEQDSVSSYIESISVPAENYSKKPTATSEQRWTPVNEKLPPDDEDVLVQYEQGGMEVVYYHTDHTLYPTEYKDLNETGWFNEHGDALYFEPVAWMPLPKSYNSQENE